MDIKSKRKELEAAGYTVSKSGTTVLKDGASVAGINENGKLWSGSSKVRDILKGESKPEVKPKASSERSRPKSEPKPRAKEEAPVAKSAAVPEVTSRKLSSYQGGRGDGISEMARRTLDRKEPTSAPTSGGKLRINYAQWKAMTRAERRAKGWPETTLALQNSGSKGVELYSKGGLARKASSSKDYRKSGRFSKSASPRGYK